MKRGREGGREGEGGKKTPTTTTKSVYLKEFTHLVITSIMSL